MKHEHDLKDQNDEKNLSKKAGTDVYLQIF